MLLVIILASIDMTFSLPAFPGAEGYGANTRGAYGNSSVTKPAIIKVSNLNNTGTGSLRTALTTSGPRIIIFTVGGTITLTTASDIRITSPYVTIAGQTAPGGGICVKGAALRIGTHDVVVRGMRWRNGTPRSRNEDNDDCIGIEGSNLYNIIIDHCSLSWGSDEIAVCWNSENNITWQWNIISEGLATQPFNHGYGLLVGDNAKNVSIHHNLFAHLIFRMPECNNNTTGEIVNNVMYHWQNKATDFITGTQHWDVRGNYYKQKSSQNDKRSIKIYYPGYQQYIISLNSRFYINGNVGPNRPSSSTGNEWDMVYFEDTGQNGGTYTGPLRANSSVNTPPVIPIVDKTAETIYTEVLNKVGAQSPVQDLVDSRIINDVKNGTGDFVYTISSSDYPNLAAGSYPTDSDNDGMPSTWETERGLDPNNKDDAHNDRDGDGYKNIEEYINSFLSPYFIDTTSDATSPSAINTLTLNSITLNSITLNWTSVGDDGTTGTATSYDIRYLANTPITANNWGSATQCSGEPSPKASGGNETFTVSNLLSDTTYYFAIKVGDEVSNWSGVSNSPVGKTLATPPADTTSPSTINTLTLNSITLNSITLNWTSVGDDGTTGTATSYDIRYMANTPITANNWGSATQCSGEPTPKVAGNSETFTVNGLTLNTTYYFAIRVSDEIPNWSGISNSPSGKTLADTTAPETINNLSVVTISSNTIGLQWTSVGDDGTTGTATSYDIRYLANTPITANNWGSATQCSGEPSPKVSGNSETFAVNGLISDTTYYFAIKVGDEVLNWSGISNIISGKTTSNIIGDMTLPSTINNLSLSNKTTNSIILNWTSVGDDGTTGTATSYDIRYLANTSITANNWGSATQCSGEPSPKVSGNSEIFAVNGLISDTTYYFAIKVGDEVPNWSGVSNSPSGKTEAIPPDDKISPSAINNLAIVDINISSVTLSWTSVGDDGTTGTATSYDIRYLANTPITANNWSNATQCSGEPSPQASGNYETFVVPNLISNMTYYFAVIVCDEIPNWSGISNSPNGKTKILSVGELAAEWHFEEGIGTTALDTSGNNNTGTLYNSPQWVNGKIGYGLQFNGQNNYVRVADNSSLDITSEISLEAWVKTAVITTDGGTVVRRVLDKGVYALGASDRAFFRINSGYISKLWNSNDINVWHHLVGTYDSNGGAGNMRLYQDSVLVASATFTGPINTNNNVLNIGRQSNTAGRFNGVIDEVKIYNRALTSSEVLQHYNSSNPQLDNMDPSSINDLNINNLSTDSITLTWTAVGDDGTTGTSTSYDIRYATYSINTVNWDIVMQCIGESSPKAAGNIETYTVNGLTSDSTYYFALKVVDEVNNWSTISNIASGKTDAIIPPADTISPSTINTLTTNNSTINSITLNWTSVGDDGTTGTADSYDIRYRAGMPITSNNWNSATQCSGEPMPQAPGNSETYSVTGLAAGTTYYFGIKAGDEVPNWSGLSNVANGMTLGSSNDNTSPSTINTLTAVSGSSVTINLTWTAVGDDGTTGIATSYDIRYATYNITTNNWNYVTPCSGEPTPGISGSSENFTINSLNENTTYYITMKVYDEINNGTGLSNIVLYKTAKSPQSSALPNTISYLTSSQQDNGSIKLSWLESISDNIAGYRIYMSTGIMDYTTPSYVVTSTQTEIIINNLTANIEYKFVVRAVDNSGNEDTNTNIISETAVANTGYVIQYKLTTPLNGMKLSGNKILLVADNITGDVSEISSVTYEYKKITDTDWTLIPVTQTGLANPDTSNPYYIQWDISDLDTNSQYNIRTMITYKNGVQEPGMSYITVTFDETDSDIYESMHGNMYTKIQRIDNRRLNTIKILDTYTNLLSYVRISTGALTNGTTDRLRITINPASAPSVSKNLVLIGYIYKIDMESGQNIFSEDIEIALPYKDMNNDNLIDDKDFNSTKLIVCTCSDTNKKWEKVTTAAIDKTNKLLITKTKHLSYYGIFAVLQSDLKIAHVYPNPFKPSQGHKKIFFADLTTHTQIKIFNIAGELLYDDEKDTPAGELSWDVKNAEGEPIASGVYMYMITNNAGQVKKGKLAIIR